MGFVNYRSSFDDFVQWYIIHCNGDVGFCCCDFILLLPLLEAVQPRTTAGIQAMFKQKRGLSFGMAKQTLEHGIAADKEKVAVKYFDRAAHP